MNQEQKYRKRRKKMRRLRKVQVVPGLIMLFLFVGFFVFSLQLFINAFFEYMVQSKLEDAKKEALEFEFRYNNQAFFDLTEFDGNYFILASDGARLDGVVPDEFVDGYRIPYGYDENQAYFYGDNVIDLFDAPEYTEFRSISLMFDFVESLRKRDDEQEGSDVNFETYQAYIKVPMADENQLYYRAEVTMKNREMMYILLIFGFSCIMVSVPSILYFITVLRSFYDQRRNMTMLYTDPITNEKNWQHFYEYVDRFIRKKKNPFKKKQIIGNLCFEKYAGYCSNYGTAAGEELLELFAKAIKKHMRKKETFARYFDAEFILYLGARDAKECNDRIAEIINELRMCSPEHYVEFTCGLCEMTKAHKDVEILYRDSRSARLSIKEDTDTQIAWFNEEVKREQIWETKVEETMEAALENGEFVVCLQPKYYADSKVLGGAEALIRWENPTEGFLEPKQFIPLFEKNGFISKIDDFMLESIAKLQAKWIAEGKNVVPISVNISRVHFSKPDLADEIYQIVEKSGVPKELIELELTESAFFEDKHLLIKTVNNLHQMGFTISMDDFGAGYSSLNTLKDLPLDVVKLDADFFGGEATKQKKGALIISETIKLAKGLGMKVVAEGIEHAEEVDFLAENGCDLIQGFYFAKPMKIEKYEKLLK